MDTFSSSRRDTAISLGTLIMCLRAEGLLQTRACLPGRTPRSSMDVERIHVLGVGPLGTLPPQVLYSYGGVKLEKCKSCNMLPVGGVIELDPRA